MRGELLSLKKKNAQNALQRVSATAYVLKRCDVIGTRLVDEPSLFSIDDPLIRFLRSAWRVKPTPPGSRY